MAPRLGRFALVAALSASCAARPSLPGRASAPAERTVQLALHGAPLTLHLATPHTPENATRPVVVYASGDGGWFGAAVDMFRMIAEGGYPTVGFSSRALLGIEQRGHRPLLGSQIAESYHAILDTARAAFGLPPDAAAIVTGWSRGATLAVLAAAEPETDRRVVGIVAIGLPREERLDVEPGDDGDPVVPSGGSRTGREKDAAHNLLMYPLMERVAQRRVAVVQASGDRYLPAAQARALFGAETDLRRFFAVPARNHRFGGGKDALRQALLDALAWAGEA